MDAQTLARMFICAFFAACFIQSGFDKIVDWKGNLGWLTGHFEKSFLRGMVPMMLGTVTLLEVSGGFACLVSVFFILLKQGPLLPMISMSIVCLNLVMLFAGQRIAKDYVGAATLAAYFIVAAFGLYITPGVIGS